MKGINTALTTGRLSIVLLSALVLAACQSDSGGDDGADGFSALISVSQIATGDDNCTTGGQRLDTGLDSDQNGVLDTNEVDPQQTVYICNGAEGPQGVAGNDGNDGSDGAAGEPGAKGEQGAKGAAGSVLKLTAEDSVASCSGYAGYKVEVGQDQNENGLLDVGEIDVSQTTYVCQGFNSIIKSEPLSAGSECPAGGHNVYSGLDLNRDKILGTEEIQNTFYVCHGATGVAGNNGADGFSIIYRIDDIALNDSGSCADKGGKRFTAYRDLNANGAYDTEDELAANATPFDVCNGVSGVPGQNGQNGADGVNAVIRTTNLSDEGYCEAGGVMIETGTQVGSEDPVWDESTTYICNGLNGTDGENGADGQNGAPGQNGENGKNSLIRITTEPMGLNCPLGGQKIEVGVDLNNSGELDSVPLNEVQHITYICSSTVPAMRLNDTGMIYGLPYGELCKNDKAGATGQDCDYGWDKVNDDGELFKIGSGAASFDFSLYLDEKENRCIKDNYTGLTWFDVSAVAPVRAYELAEAHKELESILDAGAICGIKGQWRLPTVIELQGIVHYGATFGSLKVDDTFVMTGTMENYSYWSGTLIKDEQPVGVDFTDGVIKPLSTSGAYRFFIVVSEE